VVAALTLLPALLSLLGDRINALRVPILGRGVEHADREGRFWSAVARVVMRRPVVSLVVTAALLLAAAAPVLDLRLSTPGVRALPEGKPSRDGFVALEQEFGVGTPDSLPCRRRGGYHGTAGQQRSPAARSATRDESPVQ
jgi:uncharacterized membrane protein YdfJ with MMPL/SSD domain